MKVFRLLLLSAVCCTVLAGCHVSDKKNGDGDNVEIGTPFGSMHVKTNQDANAAGIGITPYPGATPYKDNGDDSDAADVNMSFGSFHLGVRAASYKTMDGQDKVISFYKKDLARYGDVLECRGNQPVGQPTRTAEGLTCDDEHSHHVKVNADRTDDLELRTGSPDHQHIVALEAKDGGTKIGLVNLDLPQHHDASDKE